jgi:hypothetical protein
MLSIFSKLSKNVRYRKQPQKDSSKVTESQGLVQEASRYDFWERQLKQFHRETIPQGRAKTRIQISEGKPQP